MEFIHIKDPNHTLSNLVQYLENLLDNDFKEGMKLIYSIYKNSPQKKTQLKKCFRVQLLFKIQMGKFVLKI